ncbi:MAG: hypothetical protein HY909_21145 [Deltaproteobacteria bacterium]|nr:hypothetical protein [Deltaproteobacteria bacterium]
MRPIVKGAEPPALSAYRATPGNRYDGKDFTPVMDAIREALLREQGGLCCYCLRRTSTEQRPNRANPEALPEVQMKVEHWRPQSANPALELVWANLLGACLGGMGSPQAEQHCHTRKGEAEIVLDPKNAAYVATLRCRSAGRLESSDERLREDIEERLNLNVPVLVRGRRAVLDGVLGALVRRFRTGPIPVGELRRAVEEREAPTDGKLREYCAAPRLWARGRYGAAL